MLIATLSFLALTMRQTQASSPTSLLTLRIQCMKPLRNNLSSATCSGLVTCFKRPTPLHFTPSLRPCVRPQCLTATSSQKRRPSPRSWLSSPPSPPSSPPSATTAATRQGEQTFEPSRPSACPCVPPASSRFAPTTLCFERLFCGGCRRRSTRSTAAPTRGS